MLLKLSRIFLVGGSTPKAFSISEKIDKRKVAVKLVNDEVTKKPRYACGYR